MAEKRKPKKGERTYYQNFDFYFKRTCFRTMSNYFKTAYMPLFETWKKQSKKKTTVMQTLIDFSNLEFPGLLSNLSEEAGFEFIELLKMLVLSHRHNKNDDFLADPIVDFSIVREPMYKFSKQAQDKFFELVPYAFLFAWFDAKPEARAFAMEKFEENPDPSYPTRMVNETAELGQEAMQNLLTPKVNSAHKSFIGGEEKQKMAKQLQSYLTENQRKWTSGVSRGISSDTESTMV